MSALLKNTDNDLDLSTKRLVITSDLATVASQKITDVLNLFLGEWFLDTSVGTPWKQLVLGFKNPDLPAIKSMLRDRVLTVPNVVDVQDITFDWDKTTRTLNWSFDAILSNGQKVPVAS